MTAASSNGVPACCRLKTRCLGPIWARVPAHKRTDPTARIGAGRTGPKFVDAIGRRAIVGALASHGASRGTVPGTRHSLGVTTAHLATSGWHIDTWEGCPDTLRLAQEGWKEVGCDAHITAKQEPSTTTLRRLGDDVWDVVYLDGHHRRATLNLAKALGHARLWRWWWTTSLGAETCTALGRSCGCRTGGG